MFSATAFAASSVDSLSPVTLCKVLMAVRPEEVRRVYSTDRFRPDLSAVVPRLRGSCGTEEERAIPKTGIWVPMISPSMDLGQDFLPHFFSPFQEGKRQARSKEKGPHVASAIIAFTNGHQEVVDQFAVFGVHRFG
jgi:hypothetical protein